MRELFKYFALVSVSNLKNQYFKLFARFNTRHLILLLEIRRTVQLSLQQNIRSGTTITSR